MTLASITIEIDGERVSLERLVAAWRKLHRHKRKANGKAAPAQEQLAWAERTRRALTNGGRNG